MDYVVYIVAFLACAITLGNVLVAAWEASRIQARFERLEDRLAKIEQRERTDRYA